MEPERPDFVLCRGNVEYMAGKYAEAIRFYERALEIQPNYPPALRNLALAYEQLGKLEEAKGLWQKLVEHPEFGYQARQRIRDLEAEIEP
jgi:tetratricopeptide (TPR) repeat protein